MASEVSGIDPGVLNECFHAYRETPCDNTIKGGIEAAILKYRELTGGPITAEMAQSVFSSGGGWGLMAAKLNSLANRPAPAVVVPKAAANWARSIQWATARNPAAHDSEHRAASEFILSFVPTPPEPEPGQRAYEAFCDATKAESSRVSWRALSEYQQAAWAAVEATLKGATDGK